MDKFQILQVFTDTLKERLQKKTGWGRKEIESEMQQATIDTLRKVQQ